MRCIIHALVMMIEYVKAMRFIPAYVTFVLNRDLIDADFELWKKDHEYGNRSKIYTFFKFFQAMPEFRTLLYYRLGFDSRLISWIAPGERTIYIPCESIGEGFKIEHGHSTQINAKKIGKNFTVWHNVTIGVKNQFDNNSRPTIGDNVRICAGAVVVGDINIGNNVTIGANAVVVKSVPDDCVVAGNPAYIVSRNGMKCKCLL